MPGSGLLEENFETLLRDKEDLNQFRFLVGSCDTKLSFHYKNRFLFIDLIFYDISERTSCDLAEHAY